eukprot:TRINITY_DN94_c0_g2_i1.p1 TRINITY_DN94_c0_g2~~TRINITY_DN94_c0_g2_i1.p1  ORF type:complete len:512 (+),score=199.57 TRINITY_DN94_c0_g2_i1:50-1537(+)
MLPAALVALTAAVTVRHPAHHPAHKAPQDLLRRIQRHNPGALEPAPRAPRGAGLHVSPLDYGADPTGRKDSWAAFNASLQVCLDQAVRSPNGNFPGDTSFGNGKAVRDMGGCEIDLEGGEYIISQPIVLPEYVANMQFGHGSLVAAPGFKGDFLFVIGIQGSCKVPQGSCNMDINFPELFIDGAHRASGMQINNVMGVTIGPGGYFLNFTSYGLQINRGHEVMMDRAWMGETNFDFDHEGRHAAPNATAIQINGNDHYILNSIVFSSRIGVEVNGAADYIKGVHVWFPLNHATGYANTMAFHVASGGNRFDGCYIDGGRAVFTGTGLSRNLWTNGFECCQIGTEVAGTPHSGIVLVGKTFGPGLEVVHNEFKKPVQVYTAMSPDGKYEAFDPEKDTLTVTGTRVSANSMTEGVVGTRATLKLAQTAATQWDFDFCSKLLFPQIASVEVSVVAASGVPKAVARPPVGCKVSVVTDAPVTGTITVKVDSSDASDKYE